MTSVTELTASLGRSSGRTVLISLRQNREEETTSLSGTSLGAGHQIAAVHDNGDGVLLDGGGSLVVGELDVLDQVVIQGRVGEGVDRLRDIVTRGLHGDVVVIGEVDTGVLLGGIVGKTEKLAFETGIGRTGNVLAVTPLAISRASGRTTSTSSIRASVTWVSVSIWIKGPASFVRAPASVTIGTARAEIGGVGVGPLTTARAASAKSCQLVTTHNAKWDTPVMQDHIPRTTPGVARASGGTGGRGSGSTVHVSTHLASAKMGRDVSGATRVGGSGRSVLRLVEGKVSHLQAVGHICGISNCGHRRQMSKTRWMSLEGAGTEEEKKRTMLVVEQSDFLADVVLAGEHCKFLFFCTGQKERK